jgi:hypothetical protein
MIKPEELRIGNLIWNPVQQCPCKVDMAVIGKIQADAYLKSKGSEVVEFEPIPLTEQWLIDFGFEYNKIYMAYLLGEFQIDTNFENTPKFSCYIEMLNEDIQIKYVHQLQNLFYILTGEELTKK